MPDHLSEGSNLTHDERVAWQETYWDKAPSNFQIFSPSEERPWLTPKRRFGIGDFRSATTAQRFFTQLRVYPKLILLFVIADIILLAMLVGYLLTR